MSLIGLYLSLPWIRKSGESGEDEGGSKGASWLGTYVQSLGVAVGMKAGGVLIKGAVLTVVVWGGLHFAKLPGAFFLAGCVGLLVILFRPAPLVGVLVAVPMLLGVENMGLAAGILGATWLVAHVLEGRLHRWLVAGPSGEVIIEKQRFGSGFSVFGMIRLAVSLAILDGLGWVGMTWFPMYQADEKYADDVSMALDDYMAGNVAEAKARLDALATERPWDPRPYRGWLDGVVSADDFDGALEVSEKIVELTKDPKERPANGFLEEKYVWGITELDRVEAPLDPLEGYEQVLHMGGSSEHKVFRDQAAKRIIQLEPEHLEALRHLADSLQYSADRTLSNQAALKVIKLSNREDPAMLKILTGNAQLDQKWDLALKYAHRWKAADPIDSDVTKALHYIQKRQGN